MKNPFKIYKNFIQRRREDYVNGEHNFKLWIASEIVGFTLSIVLILMFKRIEFGFIVFILSGSGLVELISGYSFSKGISLLWSVIFGLVTGVILMVMIILIGLISGI